MAFPLVLHFLMDGTEAGVMAFPMHAVQQNLFCSRTADIRYVDWKDVFTKELASNSNGSWNNMYMQ